MSTKFFTNDEGNTLLSKFAGVFASNTDIERFDALVGYLRASGYFALRPHLERVPKIRILVGIDVDALLARQHRKGLLHLADSDKTLAEVRNALRRDIQSAPYQKEVEDGIRQFVADVASRRIEIRVHPTKKLHAKVYIFRPKCFCEHKPGAVITGSSNLTAAGLGTEDAKRNYEFNVLLHDYDDVQFATDEFETLWDEAVEVLPQAVTGIVKDSYLREDLTPFELYIKFLIEFFGPAIEYDPNAESDLPKGVKRLEYQSDAVTDGWLKLQKHGGFFLADVVGLGKTIVAARIAKKFFFHNGFPSHRSRILVIAPPALRDTWTDELERFGLDDCAKVLNNIQYVVPNLGRGREGNQIDLPRGSRVFFGFDAKSVPINTRLGQVSIVYRGREHVCHMRFGDNQMDKLTLPIPDQDGPATYAQRSLLFRREREGVFTLSVRQSATTPGWRRGAMSQGTLFEMRGGREYGVFS